MSRRHSTLTQQRLKDLFHYDPETGVFTRRIRNSHSTKVGEQANYVETIKGGYSRVRFFVDNRRYMAHRLAWFYMTGKWPVDEIDHIDGNALNNSYANLREATRSINAQNHRKPHSINTTGFLGVTKEKNRRKFRVSFEVAGRRIHVGMFETAEEAYDAYVKAKRIHHPGSTL